MKKVQDRAYLEYYVTGTGPSSDLAAAVSRLTWSHLGPLSLVPHVVVGSQASFLLSQQLGAISDTLTLCQFPTEKKKKEPRQSCRGPKPMKG